jgi:hypothetical protein
MVLMPHPIIYIKLKICEEAAAREKGRILFGLLGSPDGAGFGEFDGYTHPDILVTAVTTKIKRLEDAKKALTNCLTDEHVFVIDQLMRQFADLESRIRDVDNELFTRVQPYVHLVEKLDEIPGIDKILAMGIIAEASSDMSAFRDERSFAAWAGVASGNNESAGKKKDQKQGGVTPLCVGS